MSKKINIKIILLLVTIFCISFTIYEPFKLAGGPPYNTGGPGETTCSSPSGTNTCHAGGIPDNAGPATKSITFSGGTQYVPGQTYTVTVTISDPSRNRFGFQIISLRNSNNANAGTVTITDAARTWSQFPAYGPYQTRCYVMHNFNGSQGTSNQGQWSYNWTAPATNIGSITFYAAALAGNNNSTNDAGDEVYTTSLTITPGVVGVKSLIKDFTFLSIYPNPTCNNFEVNYTLEETSYLNINLNDVNGKLIQTLVQKEQVQGTYREKIILKENISPGLYFLHFNAGNKQTTRKIVIE